MKCVVNAKFLGQQVTGTQQLGIGYAKYLKEIIPEIHFVTIKEVLNTKLAEELNAVSIGIKKNFLWEQVELYKYLKQNKQPLLIDFGNTAPIWYKNKIVTILDLSSVLHPEWFSYKSRMYLSLITNAYIKNSRKIIAISNYTKKTIIDHYNIHPDLIEVAYPACPEYFDLSFNNYETGRENKYGDYIIAVSSIDPRKNFIGLIKAFNQAQLKNLKLIIVGSESKVFANQNFKNAISRNKNIIFTGYLSNNDLVALYQNALFFVYPSFFEGFGIPPLEAMKCGCPTIVSNTTSLPEVCGNASLYIDPFKMDSLVEAMRNLYQSSALRSELKEKGLKQVQLFSWKKSSEHIASIINKIIS